MANTTLLIPRCTDEKGNGLVLKHKIDCETVVIDPKGNTVEPIDYDGVLYIPCKVGDRVVVYYKGNERCRTFKITDIERSEHFFVCEIIYDELETIEMELINIAEMVENGAMTTNNAHLKADQLLVTLLYNKGFDLIADAFNRIPKYYE